MSADAIIQVLLGLAALWVFRTLAFGRNDALEEIPDVDFDDYPESPYYSSPEGMDLLEKVRYLAMSIAHAEGRFAGPNTKPARQHNPGDLVANGVVATFADDATGWRKLYGQVELMLTGASHVYSLDMPLATVAVKWTGDDNAAAWCAVVCGHLQMNPDQTLEDLVEV